MSDGFSVKTLLQWRIMVVFFFILMVNVIYTAYVTQSFEEPVKEIGDKMVSSMSDINYELERIAENETIYRKESVTGFRKFMDFFTTYSTFVLGMFAFTVWIVGIQNILNGMNGSNPIGNYVISFFIVMLINGIYIAGFGGLSALSIYFDIWTNFADAVPYLIQPFAEVSSNYYLQNTSEIISGVNQSVGNVTNTVTDTVTDTAKSRIIYAY